MRLSSLCARQNDAGQFRFKGGGGIVTTKYSVSVEEKARYLGSWLCDQMGRLCFKFWPYLTMENVSIAYEIWQSRFEIAPNTKLRPQKIAKVF